MEGRSSVEHLPLPHAINQGLRSSTPRTEIWVEGPMNRDDVRYAASSCRAERSERWIEKQHVDMDDVGPPNRRWERIGEARRIREAVWPPHRVHFKIEISGALWKLLPTFDSSLRVRVCRIAHIRREDWSLNAAAP